MQGVVLHISAELGLSGGSPGGPFACKGPSIAFNALHGRFFLNK
ncbi:hypothetical protein L21SP2_2553 [Salinispira pacifica]|uniref:Uncharacterized protein n=1 Tax=Salinispira pacifica TaxID=1307761 RepID=V5WJS1_9SPIO|nr:hypothetical protein L21SP2_2553 [Salinispira pacifica]